MIQLPHMPRQAPVIDVGSVSLTIHEPSGQTEWAVDGEPLDPAEGLARAFGHFELVSELEGLRTPGPKVLAYRPAGRRGRTALHALPERRWLEAAPDLWMARGGELLLLSPTSAVLAANLTR